MQQDAMERLNLRQLLLEPEMLAVVEPSVDLAATLVQPEPGDVEKEQRDRPCARAPRGR